MPITPTYPGVYIEELPSFTHSVTAAPTSVTVFIGYSHPFKTTAGFGTAQEIFSFTDYRNYFGGFFSLDQWLPDYLGNAVYQFFLNGGSNAWVVGLQPTVYLGADGQPVKDAQGNDVELAAASVNIDVAPATVTLSALEPGGVDPANNNAPVAIPTVVQLSNVRQDAQGNANAVADIIITYGTQVETYRAVPAADIASQLAQSALVTVEVANGAPATFPAAATYHLSYATVPPPGSTLINTGDYGPVFQVGASLDVDVPIFNLMVLPGISPVSEQQSAALSEALAFCAEAGVLHHGRSAERHDEHCQPGAGADPTRDARPGRDGRVLDGEPPPVPVSANGAIYFPYLETIDPLTQQRFVSPPSGFVAGIYAQEDASWGVGKAPAWETTINGAAGVVAWGRMTDMQQGVLNGDGVDCLRDFTGVGTVVFGARTWCP